MSGDYEVRDEGDIPSDIKSSSNIWEVKFYGYG
jgi:hypothetical protein